jgi:hypothetical protein
MSDQTSDRYELLYKNNKQLVDRADNPCIRVIHYLDKKHSQKAIVDVDNPIYVEKNSQQIKWRLIGGI